MAKVRMGWMGAIVCAFALAPVCPAPAATRTASFQVTARVEASCHMQSPSSIASTRLDRELTARIGVHCSPNVVHAVSIEAAAPAAQTDQARTHPGVVVIVTY